MQERCFLLKRTNAQPCLISCFLFTLLPFSKSHITFQFHVFSYIVTIFQISYNFSITCFLFALFLFSKSHITFQFHVFSSHCFYFLTLTQLSYFKFSVFIFLQHFHNFPFLSFILQCLFLHLPFFSCSTVLIINFFKYLHCFHFPTI